MNGLFGPIGLVLTVSQGVYLVAVFTLGFRLLRLARRTRKLPEALLASHFLLCTGLGYVLQMVGFTAARESGLLAPEVVRGLLATGALFSVLGVFAGALFNYLVFQRGAQWARVFLGLSAFSMGVGLLGSGATGGFVRGDFAGPWFWMLYGSYLAVALWVLIEPLRYYALMRKRVALGLADPILQNRFLLWGVGSLCRFGMLVVGIIPGVLVEGSVMNYSLGVVSLSLVGVALLGVGVSVSYWLTFFPTPVYTRWLQDRGTAVEARARG